MYRGTMFRTGNPLEDRLDDEMKRGYLDEGQEVCLDCGKVNCICDDYNEEDD